MKARNNDLARKLSVILLASVMLICLVGVIGCKPGSSKGSSAKSSIFYIKQSSYALSADYTLSKADEKARKGGTGEVLLQHPATFDLSGHTLNLGGLTLTVSSEEAGAQVVFKNGTISGGNLNVLVPNGDVSFDNVTITENVRYELEAASDTIVMSNSTLRGNCTVKSGTRVQIQKSEVASVTLTGKGKLEVGEGAALKNLTLSESAAGATVKVTETAKVTGKVSVEAAVNIEIEGEVAKLDVTKNVKSDATNALNVVVKETASVAKIELNAPANVEVSGKVSQVSVSAEKADVKVKETAVIAKVEVKASADVKIEGNVTDVVVTETATGAKVDVKETAKIDNVVVSANNTEIAVTEGGTVSNVKVVENVTGTTVPDSVAKETITKEDADKFLNHTHAYVVKSETPATCEKDGLIVSECVDGDDRKEVVLPKLGHDYKYEIVKLPTETENGEGKYTCSRCGHSYTVVLKADSGKKIDGLPALLKAVFGEGVNLDLSDMLIVAKQVTEKTENGNTEKQIAYDIMYFSECKILLDLADEKAVNGYIGLKGKHVSVKDVNELDLTKPEEIEYTDDAQILMYIDNDVIYGYQSSSGSDSSENKVNAFMDLETLFEYLKKDSDVPAPVKYVANALDVLFGLAKSDVDVTLKDVENTLRLIAEKLNGLVGKTDPSKALTAILNALFETQTADDGTVTYTLDFDKLKAMISQVGAMTVSEAIDEAAEPGTANVIKNLIKAVPSYTVNELIGLMNGILAEYEVDLKDVYDIIEFLALKLGGTEIDVNEMLKGFGPMTVTEVVAKMNGVTKEEAAQMLSNLISSVTSSMDNVTIADLADMIYRKATSDGGSKGENNEGTEGTDAPEKIAFIDMVLGMIDQIKAVSSVEIKVTENGTTATVKVADYEIYIGTDMTEGITLKGVFTMTEQIMAEVALAVKQNGFGLSVTAMNYYADASYDKAQGVFTALVGMNVASEGEDGNPVFTKQEMGKLIVTATEEGVNAVLTAMGVNVIDLNATSAEGKLEVVIPMGETSLPVNVTWKTVNKLTTVFVNVTMGENVMPFRFVVDLTQENVFKADFSAGAVDEEGNYAEMQKFFDVTAKAFTTNKVNNVVLDYALDARGLNIVLSQYGSSNKDGSYRYSNVVTLEQIRQKINLKINDAVTIDETIKDALKDSLKVFNKLNLVLVSNGSSYDSEKVSLTYKEEGTMQYYEYKAVSQRIFDVQTKTSKTFMGTLETTTVEGVIPAKNGVPKAQLLSSEPYCKDWYRLTIIFFGNFTTTKKVENGLFVLDENGLWVADNEETAASAKISEYSGYEDKSLNGYYNVKTGEFVRYFEHDYKVDSIQYLSESKKCDDGVEITEKCKTCGKIHNFKTRGHYYKEDRKEFANSCGIVIIRTNTCVACGKSENNIDYVNHSITETESVPMTKEELKAENVAGAYYGVKRTEMCAECNLYITIKEFYVHTEKGCNLYVMTNVGEIDRETGKVTSYGEVTYTETDRHHTEWTGKQWDFHDENKDDAVAKKGLALYNRIAEESLTIDTINYLSYESETCIGCGQKVYEKVELETKEVKDLFSRVSVYYKNGEIEHYYVTISTTIENAYEILKTVPYGFNQYEGKSARYTKEVSAYSDKNGITIDYEFRLEFDNGDYVDIRKPRESAGYTVGNYVRKNCEYVTVFVTIENGEEVVTKEEREARHNYVDKCNGENCSEDGVSRYCSVCGEVSETFNYHNGGTEPFENEILPGMVIYGDVYWCCGSGRNVTLNLLQDVVLTKDLYIAAEKLTLNLNGYTLDLNGYDLVLYGYYNAEKGYDGKDKIGGTITITDDGRNSDDGNLIFGAIVDTAKEKGMLVIATCLGDIITGNVSLTCEVFMTDNTSKNDLVKVVLAEKGYNLTINRLSFIDKKY